MSQVFLPFQLVLEKNPKLPYTLSDELTGLTIKPTSQVKENLTAINTAWSAFIASENDERIKQALAHYQDNKLSQICH